MDDSQTITVHETDSYVIGADMGRHDYAYFEHPDCTDDCHVIRYQIASDASSEDIEALLAQGTSEQVCDDGYQAYNVLLRATK